MDVFDLAAKITLDIDAGMWYNQYCQFAQEDPRLHG